MGLDLELYAERLASDGWVPIGPLIPYRLGDVELLEPTPVIPVDRNYRGNEVLMGLHDLEGFNPVTRRRGLPDDLSPVLRDWFEESCRYRGNEGWLMLGELLAHDWSQLAILEEVVHPDLEPLFHDPPVELTEEDLATWREWGPTREVGREDFVRVKFGVSHRKLVGSHLLDEAVPALLQEGPAEATRLIFWMS